MATKYTGIQKWLRTKRGQTFLNYAYSWGAAVVIAGALFKLTHIAGADIMLFLGMGTEVVVFILAGFEPQESMDTQELAEEAAEDAAVRAQVGASISEDTAAALAAAAARVPAGGSPIIAGMAAAGSGESMAAMSGAPTGVTSTGEAVDAAQLASSIQAAPAFTSPQYAGMTPEMQEATTSYVEQLNELTDTLRKVAEQSARLTRDSEEMETMNRTLTGINRFYEMQLKSVGTQSATIDEVNDQTKKLAAQLQELNEVYLKMVEALKMKIS